MQRHSPFSAEHAAALQLVLQDNGVDQVIMICVPPTFLPAQEVARGIISVIHEYNQTGSSGRSPKPVIVCRLRAKPMLAARELLEQDSIPTFDTPDRAARAIIHLNQARLYARRGSS